MTDEIIDRERLLVDLWVDGAVNPAESREVEQLLASNPTLGEEAQALRGLNDAFASLRLDLGDEFADQVMARISQRSRTWTWVAALAAAVVLALGAAALGGAVASGSGSILGTLGDFAVATLTAGAGLLGASWQGVGDLVRNWITVSPVNLAITIAMVAAINLLLFSLLRRRRRAAATAEDRRDDR